MNVVEASGLGKRYGGTWALRECTLAIPAGRVAALVGPNGAGKSTLLNLAVGLSAPSEGVVTVLGGRAAGSPAALDQIAFVAQDTPLYKNLSVADMIYVTRSLNWRFDQPYAQARLDELGIPVKRRAGKLSGGQQAQLALTLALARRPRTACRCCCPRTCSPSSSGSRTTSSCCPGARCGWPGRSMTCLLPMGGPAWKTSRWPICARPRRR